jgi:nicotinamide riboside kinase
MRKEIVAYFYEDGLHCVPCARKRFGKRLNLIDLKDKNDEPVVSIKNDKEFMDRFCEDCAENIGEIDG